MKLTLTVEKSPDPSLQGVSKSFGSGGGSIGRAAGNDWVLPDPSRYTSNHHAEITFQDDGFLVVDKSSNGTFHNDPKHLIGKNRQATLADGDRLHIGEFVLVVALDSAAKVEEAGLEASDAENDDDDDLLLPPETGANAAQVDTSPNEVERDEFDSLLDSRVSAEPEPEGDDNDDDLPFPASGRRMGPIDLDDDEEEASEDKADAPGNAGAGLSQSPEREYFAPPGVSAEKAAADIPDEWDSLLTGFFEPPSKGSSPDKGSQAADAPAGSENDQVADSPEPPPRSSENVRPLPSESEPDLPPPRRPSPPRPQQRATSSGSAERKSSARVSGGEAQLVATLMHELGIGDMADAVDADDFAEQIGRVVRLVGEGLMQLLASRADIKSEFRIDQTRITSSRNNPLKFSPSIEEAMRRVFVERDAPGFISGAEAFELALNDLRAHQVAILAAVQGAIESVILQFNPEELERKLKKLSPLSASTPLIRQAKCWNLFTAHYEEMASNLRNDAKRMFVREFAEAYERASRDIARQIAESRAKQG